MIATLGYCLRDEEITLELARWIKDLGGCPAHDLFLIHDRRCNKNLVQAILDAFIPSFKAVYPGEAPAEIDGWPQGANYFMRLISAALQQKPYGEFLWLESDAIPLVPNWMDLIEKEYRSYGKPFMGDRVDVENVDLHMSGIGVYHNPLYVHAGEAYRATDMAFDMAGKDQIVPKAHFTKLIEHAWRHGTFQDPHELTTQIRPEAVLFHASKDGSLIRLLRNEKQRASKQERTPIIHGNIYGTGSLPEEKYQKEAVQEDMAAQRPRESEEDVASSSSERKGKPPSFSREYAPGSGQARQDRQAERVRAMSQADQSETASRTPSELRPTTDSPVAMRMVPSEDARDVNVGGGGERQTEVEVRAVAPASRTPQRQDPPQPASPTCDIFIRTYHGDIHWLVYCLKAIRKFAKGFRKVWIVSPEADAFGLFANDLLVEWRQMNDESDDGYLAQQITKLYADVITDYEADYILHIDSDVILTRPITPKTFLIVAAEQMELQVVWPFTPYAAIETPWQPMTEKFMNDGVDNEFMRRFPIMVPQWLYPRLREFAFKLHRMPIADYIRNQPHRAFSEFNALGAYAFKYHHNRIAWVNTLEWDNPPAYARQFHSYSGITPEVKAEIETILSGGVERRHAVDDNAGKASQPTTPTEINRAVQSVNRNNASSGSSAPPAQTSFDGTESKPAAHHHTQGLATRTHSVPSQIKVLPCMRRGIHTGCNDDIWVLHGDQISQWVEREGRLDHDQNLLPKILEHIKPGDVVFDVGAFIGDHTVAYAKAVGETGMVYAFEPNPIAFECLEHNTQTMRNVQSYNYGLGDKSGVVPLSGNNGNSGGVYVGEHMKIADAMIWPLDLVINRAPETSRKPDFIKIDVEGYELKVLRGAEKTIMTYHPKLVIEINEEALRRQDTYVSGIFQWLENHGYTFSIMQENCDLFSPLYDILALPLEVKKDKEVRDEVIEKEPGPPPEVSSKVEQQLTMSLSLIDHVKELETYGRQGVEQMKYVRKLLKKRGIMPMTRKRR